MLIICLFFPAVISLAIHKKIYKNKELVDLFIIYVIYNFLINLFINLFSYFVSNIKENIYDISFDYKYYFTIIV